MKKETLLKQNSDVVSCVIKTFPNTIITVRHTALQSTVLLSVLNYRKAQTMLSESPCIELAVTTYSIKRSSFRNISKQCQADSS